MDSIHGMDNRWDRHPTPTVHWYLNLLETGCLPVLHGLFIESYPLTPGSQLTTDVAFNSFSHFTADKRCFTPPAGA
jgi:hypothetical protein